MHNEPLEFVIRRPTPRAWNDHSQAYGQNHTHCEIHALHKTSLRDSAKRCTSAQVFAVDPIQSARTLTVLEKAGGFVQIVFDVTSLMVQAMRWLKSASVTRDVSVGAI